MESFEIIGSHFAAKVFYELTQDVALNQSVVKITGVEMRSVLESWSAASCRVSGGVTINGSTAVKMGYSTGIMMGKEWYGRGRTCRCSRRNGSETGTAGDRDILGSDQVFQTG